MDFQQKLQSLYEMFPNHRRDTIEGILREMNGDLDNACSILFDTNENAPPPPPPSGPSHGGGYRPPPQHLQNPGGYGNPQYPAMNQGYGAPPPQPYGMPQPSYPPPQQRPPQPKPQLPKFDHIFSNDFLRWPENAQVRRVNRDGTPCSPQGYPGAPPAYPGAPPAYPGAGPAYPGAAPAYGGGYPAYPGIGVPACDPNDDLPPPGGAMPQIDIDSNLIPGVSKGDSQSWWDNFKARFKKGSSNSYQTIN